MSAITVGNPSGYRGPVMVDPTRDVQHLNSPDYAAMHRRLAEPRPVAPARRSYAWLWLIVGVVVGAWLW